MAWNVEGTYIETCSCELMCPCNLSFDHGATYDYCRVTLVSIFAREQSKASTLAAASSHSSLIRPR